MPTCPINFAHQFLFFQFEPKNVFMCHSSTTNALSTEISCIINNLRHDASEVNAKLQIKIQDFIQPYRLGL